MSEVSGYVKAVTDIRADYERRLDNARRAYDALREALDDEHSRALAAEDLCRRALKVITSAIMHGMPITKEVAAVRNAILEPTPVEAPQ